MILVYCTAPGRSVAEKLATALLDARLAACVSLCDGWESHYVWEGKRETSCETLLLIKAPAVSYGAIEKRIREVHPYECPEIIAHEVDLALPAYLQWVLKSGESSSPDL